MPKLRHSLLLALLSLWPAAVSARELEPEPVDKTRLDVERLPPEALPLRRGGIL